MKKLSLLFILFGWLATVVYITPARVLAVTGSDWRAGRIMDDAVFRNKSTMSIGQIQDFLNAKVPTCNTWHAGSGSNQPPFTCLKDFVENPTTNESNYGRPGYNVPGGQSAAQIIWEVSQNRNINPQVLLVLLQKEQSLVTDDWPWLSQYQKATGYACPDTAPCNGAYASFFKQVDGAGWQFNRYAEFPQNYNFDVGANNIQYHPNAGCGAPQVNIENRTTAMLYNYTPYQPNAAALNNLYGTGDGCSAYGNRNFWRIFNDWFGTTWADNFTLAIADNGSLTQYVLYGSIKQSIPDTETKIAWGMQNMEPVTLSAGYLNSIPNGPPLDRVFRINGGSTLYLVDSGKRYWLPPGAFEAWNLTGRVVSSVSSGLGFLPADGGMLQFALKKASSSTVYTVDGGDGSGQTVLRPYANSTVLTAWEGDNAPVTTISEDLFNQSDNAIGATLTHTKIVNNNKEAEVYAGQRFSLSHPFNSLYPGTAQGVSNATYNRLIWRGNMTHLIQSRSGPSVYLIDGGTKHHILWPDALRAWTPTGMGITTVNNAFLSLITSGTSIGSYTADVSGQLYLVDAKKTAVPASLDSSFRNATTAFSATDSLMQVYANSGMSLTGFIKSVSQPQVYLLDNSGNKRHIEWADKLVLWAGSSPNITTLPDYIVSVFGSAASPGIFVSDGSTNYVVEGGKKWTVSAGVQTDWGLSSPQTYSDGTLSRLTTAGALSNNARDGAGGYYLFRGGSIHSTADVSIAELWSIESAPIYDGALIRYAGRGFMLTRVVRSSVNGDNRLFLIDKGQWYNISDAHAANIGVLTAPAMRLNPNNAPNSITDWTSWVVKDGFGNYFVADGGRRRLTPPGTIQNQWTQDGALTVPSMSNGFIKLLPYGGIIERSFQGSGPAVYFIENSTKRHILYPDLLHNYAPFSRVSDSLLNVIPNGANISN